MLTQQIDFAVGRSGTQLQQESDSSDDVLSQDVLFRLWLARQMALMKAEGYELKAQT